MSKLRIKWSLYARESLNLIIEYISQNSPENARRVKKELVRLVGSLNDFPEKFPADTYISKEKGNFRFINKWNFKIVYELTENEIIIIDIFHSSQNPDKIINALKDKWE